MAGNPHYSGFDIAGAMSKIRNDPTSSYDGRGYSEGSGENEMFYANTPAYRTGNNYFHNGMALRQYGDGGYYVYKPSESGKNSQLSYQPYDIYDANGNYIGTDHFGAMTDGDSSGMQMFKALSVIAGGIAGGSALAGAAGAGAGAGAAAGAGGVGSTSMGLTGTLGGTGGAGFGLTSTLPEVAGGMATYGGSALAPMTLGEAGMAAAGAGGAAAGSGGGFGGGGFNFATPGMDAAGVPSMATYGGTPLAGMPGVDAAMGIGGAGAGVAGAAGGAGGGGAGGASGAFDWTKLIGPGASLINGAMGANAADKAADAQLQATREAAALSEPWRTAGTKALNRMQEILGIGGNTAAPDYGINAKPFEFTQDDPSYKWRFDQGQHAVESSAANRGGLFSGRAAKELERYGQGAASQEYQAAFNRDQVTKATRINPLQSMAGQGQTAANTIGSYTLDGGNAQAAGQVGSSNAWSNAISGALNNYQSNELMNRLLRS